MILKYSNIVNMPTIGHPPTHMSTQAVGIALLHQFARDRFREENMTESLIDDAEQELSPEICEYFSFTEDQDEKTDKDRTVDDDQSQQTNSTSVFVAGDASQLTPERPIDRHVLNLSTNSTGSQSNNNAGININSSVGPLNSTVKPHDFSGDDSTFHSMASSNDGNTSARANESSASIADSNVTLTNDNRQAASQNSTSNMTQGDSIYHSMNATGQRGFKNPNTSNNNSTTNDTNANHDDENTDAHISTDPKQATCHHRVKPNLDKHLDSTFKAFGQTLRKLADDFAKSKERQTVRDQASRVQLESVNQKSFLELLDGLFAGGITSEKIVVLFFFCVDVAVRAYSEAQHLVVELLKWSFSFIINTVCKKVEELGGWEKVLFYQMPSVLVSCLAVLGIGALITYLHKSLRSS